MKNYINELKEKYEDYKERKRYMKILNYFKDFSLYESSILEERMEKEKILKETEDIKKETKIAIEKVKKEMDEDTINIVKKLLKTNLDIKTISDCTGLSIEKIKNLPLD